MARDHQRKIIRDAVQALLKGKTGAEDRVFKSRIVPFTRLQLPAITVYARSEPVDPDSARSAPRVLQRNLHLVIEVADELTEGIDDALDALCLEIEQVMDPDPTFGDTANDSILANTEIEISEDGKRPIGVAVMTYAVTYFTDAPDERDLVRDDLKTVDAKTELAGVSDPAEDLLERLDER
jgi:hypothetical protein